MTRPKGEPAPPTVKDLIALGVKILSESKVPNPRPDTDLLLCAALEKSREKLYCELDVTVGKAPLERFFDMLERRSGRCPISYILQEREFYSLSFRVDSRVLIPRQETELLVDKALEHAEPRMNILDIGTGSACIAVSLASKLPGCHIWGSDISPQALEVARENITRHGLDDHITLIEADILPSLSDPFHMMVSNPPYVAGQTWEELMPEVKEFEPIQALVPGPTGLEFYPRLVEAARKGLAEGGILIAELGVGQADDVSRMFMSSGLTVREIAKDFSGIARVIVAEKPR